MSEFAVVGAFSAVITVILIASFNPSATLIGSVFFVIGVIFDIGLLAVCYGVIASMISRDPWLIADADGVSIRELFGRVRRVPWARIGHIEVVEVDESVGEPPFERARHIYFWLTTETRRQNRVPSLDVPEYRMDLSIDQVIQELEKIPGANNVLSRSKN